jgi:type IV secretory pathway ATPase VirB11/archaellum biosynthesis ATPase
MNTNLRFLKLNNNFRNIYSFNKKSFVVAQNIIDYTTKTNPRVFLTVTKNGANLGKLTFEVIKYIYFSYTPITALKQQKILDNSAQEQTKAV